MVIIEVFFDGFDLCFFQNKIILEAFNFVECNNRKKPNKFVLNNKNRQKTANILLTEK